MREIASPINDPDNDTTPGKRPRTRHAVLPSNVGETGSKYVFCSTDRSRCLQTSQIAVGIDTLDIPAPDPTGNDSAESGDDPHTRDRHCGIIKTSDRLNHAVGLASPKQLPQCRIHLTRPVRSLVAPE